MRFSFIPFMLLIIPILEIATFIVVGREIGTLPTLLMILVTAIIGSILLRYQGFQILTRIRQSTERGELPGEELGHGAMILVAGILLLTPGFITDTIGFLLFIPAVRRLLWKALRSHIHVVTGGSGGFTHGEGGYTYYRHEEGVVDLDPDDYHETTSTPQDDTEKNNKLSGGTKGKSPWS